jgi:hypothetical protein
MLFFKYLMDKEWDIVAVCNGLLAGLVGVTAGCSVIEPWAAVVCGLFAPMVGGGHCPATARGSLECALTHFLQSSREAANDRASVDLQLGTAPCCTAAPKTALKACPGFWLSS